MPIHIFTLSESKPIELMYFLMGADIEFDLQTLEASTPVDIGRNEINIIYLREVAKFKPNLIRNLEKQNTFVMLSAADPAARLAIIELGVSECLHYPTQFKELAIKMRRRAEINERSSLAIYLSKYLCDDLQFDAQARTLKRDGTLVKLSKMESRILALLASRPNSIVSKGLIDREMGRARAALHSRAIDVAISSVRARLRSAGAQSELMTIRSIGYRLNGHWVSNA
ncbi:MAG: DNA-binding response regulator [Hyphomicrobiales bacterium]|nr:DNA-binding response regulator [Hyphomicrobiales bacterium]